MKVAKQSEVKNVSSNAIKQSKVQSMIITNIQDKKLDTKLEIVKLSPIDVITKHLIEDILQKVTNKIQQNTLINALNNKFSNKFATSYINENIDKELFTGQKYKTLHQQQQPNTIKSDNLCPVSTSLQQKHSIKDDLISLPGTINQSLTGRLTRNMSMVSRLSRNNSKNNVQVNSISKKTSTTKGNQLIKLVVNQKDALIKQDIVISDPYVQELRRIKQVKPKQQLNNNNKQEKKQTLRQKIKLDQKISYDFTGNILKINQKPQKTTLLTAQIKTTQNQGLTTRPYQSSIQKTPINIDNSNVRKNQAKKLLSSTRQPQVQFSNVMSLVPHLEINDGTKFIHNKATVQKKKKKQSSLMQIKKSLSLNKISRSQFARLKQVNNNNLPAKHSIPSLPSLRNNNNSSIFQDSQILSTNNNNNNKSLNEDVNNSVRSLPKYTQPKKRNNNNLLLLTERSCQRVSVQNEELTQMLFDDRFDTKHAQDIISVRRVQDEQGKNNNSNLQALSPRDIANLHYVRTNGTIGKLQLPKITYRLTDTAMKQVLSNSILQSKTKIKGKRKENQFERLKKHFQDKLRV